MGVAYPGFKDFYAEGGAGASLFTIPHNDGQTLDETLTLFTENSADLDFLQLATFNDFGEGTMFEPTQETGFDYLARVQEFTGVSYTEDDLKRVYRLFTLRKKYADDGVKQEKLSRAADHLIMLEVDLATAVMDTVAGVLGPVQLPGMMEAERFTVQSGIETATTSDVGGGTHISGFSTGDLLKYEVEVLTSGDYLAEFRVASESGGKITLADATQTLLAVTIPSTGGSETWRTVSVPMSITKGEYQWTISAVEGTVNLNWLHIGPPTSVDIGLPELEVFPTRTSGSFQLESSSVIDDVAIVDAVGRVVRRIVPSKGEQTVNVGIHALPAGLYHIKVIQSGRTLTRKVIKE
jgi:hypothetical protein